MVYNHFTSPIVRYPYFFGKMKTLEGLVHCIGTIDSDIFSKRFDDNAKIEFVLLQRPGIAFFFKFNLNNCSFFNTLDIPSVFDFIFFEKVEFSISFYSFDFHIQNWLIVFSFNILFHFRYNISDFLRASSNSFDSLSTFSISFFASSIASNSSWNSQ